MVSTRDFSECILEYHSIASMLILIQTYSDRSEIYDTMTTTKLFWPESQMQQRKRSTLTFHTILVQEKRNLIKTRRRPHCFFHQWYPNGRYF